MLYQTRHVVYHSHYPRILDSHRSDNAQCAQASILPHLIWRSDQGTTAHRVGRMFAADDDVHVAGERMLVYTLVKNLDQARLLFEHAKQVAHAFDVVEVGLGQD